MNQQPFVSLPDIPDRPLDVLVIAPHPDDAELGAGGAILRMKAEGWRVGDRKSVV